MMLRYRHECEKWWIQGGSSVEEKNLNVWWTYNLFQIKFTLSNMDIYWMIRYSYTMTGFKRVFMIFWAFLYTSVSRLTSYDSKLFVLMWAFDIWDKLSEFPPEFGSMHYMHSCNDMKIVLMLEESNFSTASYKTVISWSILFDILLPVIHWRKFKRSTFACIGF